VHPCLVALVTRYDNKLSGIQRTYLTDDGRKADVSTVKLSLGRVAGSAIRLAPVASELIVCEGAEDGLSLQQELGRAVWASAGASMLAGMQFPSVVQSVVIGADNDDPGEREALKAAEAFTARGLKVRIMRPIKGFKDFNEQLASGEAMGRAA
jgi:DNA primase